MERLLDLLSTLKPDIDFTKNIKLIDDDILDSFDIVNIVGEINDIFDIQIGVEDLLPENFNSINAMMKLIERLQDE